MLSWQVALALGLLAGRAASGVSELEAQVGELEARADELGGYEIYAEHLRDVLADLHGLLSGRLRRLSLRDYVEKGIFEPAHRLLSRDGDRGDVRFSVLYTDGQDFVMARGETLFPALVHSLEARQQFRLPIDDAFAGVAYRTATVQRSGDVTADHRFTPHPRARPERGYRSIVSVPLRAPGGAEIDGVFNVIATEPHAFSAVDRTYAALLGAVIDVARAGGSALERRPEHPPE